MTIAQDAAIGKCGLVSTRKATSNRPGMAVLDTAADHVWIPWLLTLLFSLRVAGQALQRWKPQPFLPPFHSFQGSHMPYSVLLPAQLLILTVMFCCSWRAQRGTGFAGGRTATALLWCGALYMAASVARLAIGLGFPAAAPWYRAWISDVFHLVLAGFVLVLAAHQRRAWRAGK